MKPIKLSERMKNVAKISSGTVLGQVISILSLPIVTRMYGAQVMGMWASMYAIAIIISTVSDLGLSQALMVEEKERVEALYQLVSTLSILLSAAAFVLVAAYEYLLGGQGLWQALAFALFVFAYAFTIRQVQTCYTWLNREKQYSVLMKNPIINAGVMAGAAIVLGLLGFKQYGYYIGMVLGQVVTLWHMRRSLPRRMFVRRLSGSRALVGRHRDFVRYQMPTQLVVQVRSQLPNILIGTLFGNVVLGYFSISQKLLSIPVTMVGQALGKVFYQSIAEMQRKGQSLAGFVFRNLQRAMKIAFIPMLLFAAFGDAAITMFFGSEYGVGGVLCRIIVFRSFMTFVSTATQGLDIVLHKQRAIMLACIYQTVLACASVVLAYYLAGDISLCALLMSVTFIAVEIGYFCRMFTVMQYPARRYARSILLSLGGILLLSLLLRQLFLLLLTVVPWGFLHWLGGFMVKTSLL